MGGAKRTGGSKASFRAAWTARPHFVPTAISKDMQPAIEAQMPSTWVGSHSKSADSLSSLFSERRRTMAICVAAIRASKSMRCR